jgi:hypothetical protein
MKVRNMVLRVMGGLGAIIGYGCLVAFLCLIGEQTYRWFREGEWMHVGMGDGIRIALVNCCVKDGGGGSGSLTVFLQWWQSPATWLGMHKVFEVIPASLALFAVSIVGNSLFIYCRDRLHQS